ncbi:MAG TPA: hypothetical protein PLE19_05605 [Planctomycetota bacterium]|nr:hypothetical protein [Planctomycetota bacterium]HRR80211.1 hypothetical protein [Planctomycetota bacterium]HRT93197.1 hypothetical protein [Planctomycetota bacterium]
MRDPLVGFDWPMLYDRYDGMCKGFDSCSPHLRAVAPHVRSDRFLYYHLIGQNRSLQGRPRHVAVGDYEAMLYWKLYSQPAARRLLARIGADGDQIACRLDGLVKELPASMERDLAGVVETMRVIDRFRILGMGSRAALPVRITSLHFLYPSVVPIFDQMVLKAVGAWQKGANQELAVLKEYIPFAWQLADQHARHLAGFAEPPVPLVDMALWAGRGKGLRAA